MRKWNNIAISPEFCVAMAISLLVLPLKWIAGWLGAVLIHELSHLTAMIILGVGINGISMNADGAVIRTEQMHPWQELICAFAGPVGGLLPLLFIAFTPHLGICAFLLSMFNLLPIYPMDGGRGVFCLCRMLLKETIAVQICTLVGRLTLVAVFVVTLLLSFVYRIWLPCVLGCIFLMSKFRGANPSCKDR